MGEIQTLGGRHAQYQQQYKSDKNRNPCAHYQTAAGRKPNKRRSLYSKADGA